MNYTYFKDKIGNFGDDLNGWLWPRIFGEPLDDGKHFLGIGTILGNSSYTLKSINPYEQKIVFGSGAQYDYRFFNLDKSWDIKFLRGPLSSHYLKIHDKYITDAAYALTYLKKDYNTLTNSLKKHEISFMPHKSSVPFLNWESICKELGYNYISPYSEKGVLHTMQEIASSKQIITEAMHGAILADILRVPWTRFLFAVPLKGGELFTEFKWADWLMSINLKNEVEANAVERVYRKTPLNNIIKQLTFGRVNIEFFIKRMAKENVLKLLSQSQNYHLSSDNKLNEISDKIFHEIKLLQKELSI